jgi:outer membrane protein assembly factor BamA
MRRRSLLQFIGAVAVLAGLLVPAGAARGQADSTDVMAVAREDTTLQGSTIIPFPFFFTTPETGAAVGATLIYYFRPSKSGEGDRPSTISPVFVYTSKKQIITFLESDIYLGGGRYRTTSEFGYSRFPNTFWGVGNNAPESAEEDYTPRTFTAGAEFRWQFAPGWYAGGNVGFADRKLLETTEGGLLDTGAVPGTVDGQLVTVGLLISLDTRDDITYPRSGSLHQLSVSVYDEALGSDYGFVTYSVDLRRYVSVFGSHVLALWGLGWFSTGSPPFDLVPQLGGDELLRGYFEGRYRDRDLLALQAEYRAPVWWRFGVVGFAGVGQVSPDLSGFGLDAFHASGGAGVRFLLSPGEGLNLRADLGFGENGSGFYLSMGEAF